MITGYRLFDAHAHLGVSRHSGRTHRAEWLLGEMDRHGVDRALIIPFPVVEDERAAHDEIGEAVRRWPDRFAGAACLYPYVAGAAFRAEVRRCREEYGFVALKLQPQYQALNPIAASSAFLFETALENRMTLVCHTGSGVPYALPSLFMLPARNYPDLAVVLAHAGGGIFSGEAIVAASFCPNIYLELSSLLPHQVREVLAHVPAARLMVGSDLPENTAAEFDKILDLETSDENKRQILWDTARELFGGAR